ncbi:DUF2505 domain-containing protein [Flexivirga caeni]|uniref:DUF2505 domain-containing protein n=1 Tax=Flexivirga caeni TaxID=2294115 RepID=A0A3M9MDI2_9MICO|nr:DUF2505 domain-containing protein [Flexivirga caeni]RNI23207.1 DUF2505 domain-containing protein [Flexivirga caeni]
MKIEETWTYDAPADRVFAMLLDPAFQESKCAATGALTHSVTIDAQPPGDVIETHREMSTDGLPDNVSRLIGKTLRIVEIQRWGTADADDVRSADLTVSISGLPIDYTGQIRMTPDGDHTSMVVSGDLRARIPLFGSKVESASAPAISSGVRIEAETGAKYLAG